MIYTHKSNNLEVLADLISDALNEHTSGDPFKSDKIIVPNLDTSSWLKLKIAEKNGFAGNIKFLLPGEWLYTKIREIYPDLPGLLPSDPEPMTWTIFELLSDKTLRSNLKKIDRYINAQPDENSELALIQISKKIASLYDQYLLYRPELILKWESGDIGKGDEEWQAKLWVKMNSRWKSEYGTDLSIHKAELYRVVFDQTVEGGDRLYLFNPGLIAQPIVELMKKVGIQQDVFLYLISPAQEIDKNSHSLLSAWGKEAEAVEVQYETENLEVSNHFSDINSNNQLHEVQNSISRQQTDLNLACPDNKLNGIDVRSCHSTLREVEVLYTYLAELFEADEKLSPDEILVVSPDMSQYTSTVKAVFENHDELLPKIPFHIAGNSNKKTALFERSISRLLQIADSRFNSTDILDFLTLQPIREHLQLSESDVSTIRQWIEENHVYWGMDKNHREELNQPAVNLQTWNSAIRRVWLGQTMASKKGELWNDTLLYDGLDSTSDQLVWSRFTQFLNKLDKVRSQTKSKRKVDDWCDLIDNWMSTFFSERLLSSETVSGTIKSLQSFKENAQLAKPTTEVSYSVIKQELDKKLNEKRSGSAKLNRGVTFSNMVPVRSLPFKVIALIGLNEGVFPRKLSSPDYDLMVQNPNTTDRNRRNEDRNLFLESIMATKERHYCSYIGQDRVDNEQLPPSPIVSDWIGYLSKSSGLKEEFIVKKESISSFSPNSFLNTGYESLDAICAKKINLSKDESSGLILSKLPDDSEDTPTLSPSEFVAFFSNPIRAYLRNNYKVRLRDLDEEKDEFELNHLDKYQMFIQTFGWLLEGYSESEIVTLYQNSGKIPIGWKGDSETIKLITNADKTIQLIRSHGFTPEFSRETIDLDLNHLSISGEVQSFSKEDSLDISFSSMSGKNLLNSWIKHLMVLSTTGNSTPSYLLCEPKNGDPNLIRFTPVENSDTELNKLADHYLNGHQSPLWFFPKTVYEYVTNLSKGEDTAVEKARVIFEGNDSKFSFPENGDLNVSFLMGENPGFRKEFVSEPLREIVKVMMDHMEEIE